MTKAEAEKERDRLSADHPEATWLVREAENETWEVVRVAMPQSDETRIEEKEERSRPPYPDDPVGSTRRNFNSFGAN